MDYLKPSDLKTILHSKRANIYYLEKCRVQVNGGRVEYITTEGDESLYWNIPIANTTAILLGMGTSITQAAMREFAHAGVLVGFCGSDGTPLYSANEVDIDVSWLSPQSEYRPTSYVQNWLYFWFDDEKRLQAAKTFQIIRLEQIQKIWLSASLQRQYDVCIDEQHLLPFLADISASITQAEDHNQLMLTEAKMTKRLLKCSLNRKRILL